MDEHNFLIDDDVIIIAEYFPGRNNQLIPTEPTTSSTSNSTMQPNL